MTNKKPIKVFKAGGVRAAIWENKFQKDGKTMVKHSTQIDRTYKQDGEFKRTNQFNEQDLPKAQLVAAKAYEFLSLKSQETSEDEESK